MTMFLGTFLTFSASDTAAVVDTGKSLISDLMPLLIIILGIGLALWIVEAFLHHK